MKLEILRQNSEINQKRYDLEDRTLAFAKAVRQFCGNLPKTIIIQQDVKQIVRSSGSMGANYLEANESLSKKDFLMRVKIAKKETRETIWWLELMTIPSSLANEHSRLQGEATEIMNIFGAILRNSK